MLKNTVLLIFLLGSTILVGQEKNKINLQKPHKLGFLYSYGSEDNFIFNDPDYTYHTHIVKAQLFYQLKALKQAKLNLVLIPQYQRITHQLINEQFVTPNQENYIEKRIEFMQKKGINLFGVALGISYEKPIALKTYIRAMLSLGFNHIDTRSERLAKGFTFSESLSLGIEHQLNKKAAIYLGTSFGHVSNLNFQLPNDGYNILGIELGYSILWK